MRLIKLIVLFLAVILFVGCVPTRVQTGDSYWDMEELDFYGLEFIIMQFTTVTLNADNPMLYINGTTLADMALARLDEIESEYNCGISITYRKRTGNWQDYILTQTAVAQPVADIFLSGDSTVTYNLMKDGFLYPMSEVSDIIEYDSSTFDLYGSPALLESAMYDGDLYMVTPYSHPARQLNSSQFFAVNTKYVTECTGVDVRALNEQGQWTWTAFENMVRLCNGRVEGTIVRGASLSKADFLEYACVSNGFVRTKSSTGGYNFNFNNVTNAIDWVKRTIKQYGRYMNFESMSKGVTGFAEGRNAMVLVNAEYLKNVVAYQASEFAVVPFPCGPMGNPDTNRGSSAIEGLGIYTYGEAPEQAAYIIKAYCQPFDEFPTLESALGYYDNLFWDTRDTEVLINAEKNPQFNYSPAGGTKFFKSVSSDISEMSVAQLLYTYSNSLNKVVQDMLVPNKELIDKLDSQ